MSSERLEPDEGELFHVSLHEDKATTVVLLHGLLSCHLEWALVIPHLQDYHVLAIDISGHSRSRHILPADLPTSTDRIASIIQKYAKNGQAHVVGLSMGAFIALRLSRTHPTTVQSLFITAGHPMRGIYKFVASHPSITYYMTFFTLRIIPPWLYFWVASLNGVARHDELYSELKKNRDWNVIRDVDAGLMELSWEDVRAVPVKTLAIAAGTIDDVEAVRRMGRELPVEGSLGAVVRGAVHSWDLQKPELFAQGIRAWIEGTQLPGEIEVLK